MVDEAALELGRHRLPVELAEFPDQLRVLTDEVEVPGRETERAIPGRSGPSSAPSAWSAGGATGGGDSGKRALHLGTLE